MLAQLLTWLLVPSFSMLKRTCCLQGLMLQYCAELAAARNRSIQYDMSERWGMS